MGRIATQIVSKNILHKSLILFLQNPVWNFQDVDMSFYILNVAEAMIGLSYRKTYTWWSPKSS